MAQPRTIFRRSHSLDEESGDPPARGRFEQWSFTDVLVLTVVLCFVLVGVVVALGPEVGQIFG